MTFALVLKYWQLILGAIGCLVLGVLLVVQKGETRHFTKLYNNEVVLYDGEHRARLNLETDYRNASATAIEHNQEMLAATVAHDQAINERTKDAYETRLADVHNRLDSLRAHAAPEANSGGGKGPPVSSVPTPTCGTDAPTDDPITRAFDCAIQLDAIQEWVKSHTAKIETNGNNVSHY